MNVLDWRAKRDWLSAINDYAPDILGENLLQKIRSSNITGCWSDNMSWLPDPGIVDLVESRFRSHYSHVKGFHGCRPSSVRNYYEKGLVGQNKLSIENQFNEVFKGVSSDLLEQAISQHNERGGSEKGKIYFVCSDTALIESCGHYLIQGSEYMMAMAASLCRLDNRVRDYRLRLRKFGIPTIFEVNIPLNIVPDIQIRDLVRTIVASWGDINLFPDDAYNHEVSFVLHVDVDPEHIVRHTHPEKIHDPHFSSWYRPEITRCEMCYLAED
jgi:hypothetical protein